MKIDTVEANTVETGTVEADTAYSNEGRLDPRIAARLKRDNKGLVAAVIQQYDTHEVLMVGYMNDEALRRTLTTGRVTFWSRSRQEYWRKGDTSGHVQYVKGAAIDCDGDALLIQVEQIGAACHTGARSCFDAGGPLPVVIGPVEAAEIEASETPNLARTTAGSTRTVEINTVEMEMKR
ncbi:phosphoribosyl-AMP cyclohydrolase [Bifidobacterium tibiigranuli]|jgi:phosphoribosyl-AMP cyclohydrolase|uniref:phosphoribosyl-AMP cyclohydrolase n=1 Tax=Bifidobacterium tibiigranuli TaxID=2172043 RepID=UPI0026EDF747|nr:phosphoribosyl-AMP cyclohydrolase [Bifidobacterium tibiigranuli]MCI1650343.1 phosphoribosyl-AMP cyclohydrolase [Bifidobacterium tibiigranuli]MCI2185359.1 phosphoribosyl-AMP cyclohydrolase [Bifidobacterium tibiigranuli]MCI2203666.1 phosphoribosyl-AMP cyclohydrolase [Bifidobacterium tibiigranuli]